MSLGEAVIKFRIEDVSKNHQNYMFKLETSPDPRRSADIAPVSTPGITVRSKRNKRQSSPHRRKLTKPETPMNVDDLPPHSLHPLSPIDDADKRDLGDISVNDAIIHILNWSNEVSNILPSLKWNLIGYCQNVDRSPDYSKPNHIMPYPNDCISRIMNSYSKDIKRCLLVLQDAIARVGSNGNVERHPDVDANRRTQMSVMNPPAVTGAPPYFPGNTDYDNYFPHNTFEATPVTPQTLQNFQNVSHSSAIHTTLDTQDNSDPRKRQRHDDTIYSPKKDMDTPMSQEDTGTKDVEYILAKNFKKLGFPVYNSVKDLIGFYRESNSEIGVGNFFRLSSTELSPRDRIEATRCLEEAIAQKSQAVHCIKDWQSLTSMFDQAMVYDWSKDFNGH